MRTTASFSLRGLELAYHCFGDRDDFPIVCLHGFMDHGLSFAPMVRALSTPFFVVTPDHRGHGMSGWVGAGGYYYFHDYFQDVVALVEHLGLERFGLVGHSMGGSIATGVAALLPKRVQSVVLIEGMGPPFSSAGDAVGRIERWIHAVRRSAQDQDEPGRRRARKPMESSAAAADRLCLANPRLDRSIAEELAGTFTEPAPGGPKGAVVWRLDPLHRTPSPKAYLREEAEPTWRTLTMPVLSIYGRDTPWQPGDLVERHACLPNARPVLVDGAGHNIHHERPLLMATMVADWMAGKRDAVWEGVSDGVLS